MIVRFRGSVLEITDGEDSFEPGPCPDMRRLIDALTMRYGESFSELINRSACFFIVNGKGTMSTGGFDTPLKHGDKVEVLPLVEAG